METEDTTQPQTQVSAQSAADLLQTQSSQTVTVEKTKDETVLLEVSAPGLQVCQFCLSVCLSVFQSAFDTSNEAQQSCMYVCCCF